MSVISSEMNDSTIGIRAKNNPDCISQRFCHVF